MAKEEQMFCSKCGKTNWSKWFNTCECKEPDFSCNTYDEYLAKRKLRKLAMVIYETPNRMLGSRCHVATCITEQQATNLALEFIQNPEGCPVVSSGCEIWCSVNHYERAVEQLKKYREVASET